MRSRIRPRSGWLLVLALFASVHFGDAARGDGITGIVSFGDSLSDVGNAYLGSGMTQPAPVSAYYQGHFSNGPIWVEYLAKDLGVAAPRLHSRAARTMPLEGHRPAAATPASRAPRSRTSGPRSTCIWHTTRRAPPSSSRSGAVRTTSFPAPSPTLRYRLPTSDRRSRRWPTREPGNSSSRTCRRSTRSRPRVA